MHFYQAFESFSNGPHMGKMTVKKEINFKEETVVSKIQNSQHLPLFKHEDIEKLDFSKTMRNKFNKLKDDQYMQLCGTTRGKAIYIMKVPSSKSSCTI